LSSGGAAGIALVIIICIRAVACGSSLFGLACFLLALRFFGTALCFGLLLLFLLFFVCYCIL